MSKSAIPEVRLRSGFNIPQIGLGTWQSTDEKKFHEAIKAAYNAGYRHFDTAQAYNNEQMLGQSLKTLKIVREDIFITTKIHIGHFGHKKLHESFDQSLRKLETDYVDLLLLHFPVPVQRKRAWQELENINASGMAKSIGVSNYTIRHLEDMKRYQNIVPAVNQVELHVFLQQPELISYCQENDIVVEAYSPIARAHIMDNPAIQQIAQKHNKTYVQIMLRFLIELGLVVLPKSVTTARIQENIEVFDFSLDKDDIQLLKQQDKDKRFCWSPVHVP